MNRILVCLRGWYWLTHGATVRECGGGDASARCDVILPVWLSDQMIRQTAAVFSVEWLIQISSVGPSTSKSSAWQAEAGSSLWTHEGLSPMHDVNDGICYWLVGHGCVPPQMREVLSFSQRSQNYLLIKFYLSWTEICLSNNQVWDLPPCH